LNRCPIRSLGAYDTLRGETSRVRLMPETTALYYRKSNGSCTYMCLVLRGSIGCLLRDPMASLFSFARAGLDDAIESGPINYGLMSFHFTIAKTSQSKACGR
jgi:hypothetical protein